MWSIATSNSSSSASVLSVSLSRYTPAAAALPADCCVQVSGPSYIYQDVVHDLDPPDFLIQKFGHQSQHYGSTVSLTVPDYPEPRLANNPRAFDIERRSFPQGADQDLGGGNDLFNSVEVSRQIEL